MTKIIGFEIKPSAFDDILTDKTRKVRRSLIIVSFASFFMLYPGVVIKNAFVDLTALGDTSRMLAAIAIVIINGYLLVTFEMYRSIDFQRLREKVKLSDLAGLAESLTRIGSLVEATKADISLLAPWLEPNDKTIGAFSIKHPSTGARLPVDFEEAKNVLKASFGSATALKDRFESSDASLLQLSRKIDSSVSSIGDLQSFYTRTYIWIDLAVPRVLAGSSLFFSGYVIVFGLFIK